MDESWVYQYDPETKTMTWNGSMSTPLLHKRQRCKSQQARSYSQFFWDCHGIILTDYLPKGQTITVIYYSNLLDKLQVALKNKRCSMLSRGIHLLADNAPAQSSQVAVDKVRACGYGVLQHPPYSPDLATSDFSCSQK